MTTRRRLPAPTKQQLPLIAQLALVLILFFVAIGDVLRLSVSFIWHIIPALVHTLSVFTQESGHAASDWFGEKLKPKRALRHIQKKERKPALPIREAFHIQAKPILSTGRLLFNAIRTIRIPAIRMPSISLPKLVLPNVSYPKVSFRLPSVKLSLPTRKKQAVRLAPRRGPVLHFRSLLIGVTVTIVFVMVPYNTLTFLRSLPNPQLLTQRDLDVSTKILDRNGQLLYEIYSDQNRTPVKLENIPLIVKEATIAIEDRDFYHHPGFSIRGIARAATQIVVHKQLQGGSTITQQLIKSALLTPDVSIVRKAKEIILAFWAERLYSKDQILEMYLNQVPYGGTAWGIESAAQTYFHKSVSDLTLAQAALLAGLPAAPSEYSPFGSHPELAIERQHEVLAQMESAGYITHDELTRAVTEPMQFADSGVGIHAPHFVMYVKQLLEEKYGPRLVERGGLRVTTSLDLNLQEKVESIVKTNIAGLANLQVGNGAALVTNPQTGEILAMVGSHDYFDTAHDGNVNVTTALRQPGSSIKVVTYATALESGMTAATIINDAPIVYRSAGSPPYAPVNYDSKFHGPVPLRYALANSYNIPAVKTLAAIGVPAMMAKAKLMGIDSWSADPSQYGLSLTLGGGDVTMLEMAKVFGTLANMGKREDLMPILSVTDYTGKVWEEDKPSDPVDAVRPDVAWILSDILADNAARTPAFGPNSSLVIPGKTVSVKTGTTNDKRDNWTIGYTPSFVTVVWVGNNDNSPMNPYLSSGITGAAPIWHDIMTTLLADRPDETEPKPDTIVSVPCYFNRVEYFISGTEPATGRCNTIPTITPTPTPH